MKNQDEADGFVEWAKMAESDDRISVAEWKEALDEIEAFNGHQFNQDPRKVDSYQRHVVNGICKLVLPDIKRYDSHVQAGGKV